VEVNNAQGYRVRKILNDNLHENEWRDFVRQFCLNLKTNSVDGALIYLVMSAQEWPMVDANLRAAGFHWSSTIIWAKDRLVLSRKDYHTQYEPIWYGWNDSAARLKQVEDRKQSDVWFFDRPHNSDLHPTMKPVELIAKSLENSSEENSIVLDPFGGSGSTLIACEKTNRICHIMELDPHYVDVIARRYQKLTGDKPVLAKTEEAHDFLDLVA
jgi:DNA modification methylase